MDSQDRIAAEYYTIDLVHIFKSIWRRIWIVILAGILAAVAGFTVSTTMVSPKYSASIMLYVNNSSFSLGKTNFSISTSEIVAAQSLVKTYTEILDNRTTLERVIDKAKLTCSYKELSSMIKAEPSNETEIMKVTVTAGDPYEASKIANSIADVLPVRISEIIDGASMEVVDSAVPDLNKISPSTTSYTVVGMFLGVFFSVLVLAVLAMLDDTIHDEEYILRNYEYPVLAKVPNLLRNGNKQTNYGYRARKNFEN